MAYDILIVDDEPDIRLLIDGILRDEGYETRGAGDADAAIAAFRMRRPSLVILDVWLQGSRMDGLATAGGVPQRGAAGAGGDDLRPRQHRDGGAGDPAGRLRLHREAVQVRSAAAGGAPCAGSRGTGAGERRTAAARRPGDHADRREHADRRPACRCRARGADRFARADPGAGRQRQGGRGAHGACAFAPRRWAVRGAELRDARAGPLRGGAVRPGGRRRSDRAAAPRRRAGARAWRHAAAGRGLRHAAGDAGQDRPRAAGSDLRASRRFGAGEGGRAGAVHHQQGPADRDRRRAVPRGPVLPAGGGAAEGAGAEGAPRGRAGAGAALHRALGRECRDAVARAVGRHAGGAAGLRLAGQCAAVAQSDGLAADHGAGQRGRSDPRRDAAAGDRRECAGAAEHRSDGGHHGPAAARGARSVRDAVSAGAVAAFRRQYQPDRAVRRHGAQRAAPQAEAAWG